MGVTIQKNMEGSCKNRSTTKGNAMVEARRVKDMTRFIIGYAYDIIIKVCSEVEAIQVTEKLSTKLAKISLDINMAKPQYLISVKMQAKNNGVTFNEHQASNYVKPVKLKFD